MPQLQTKKVNAKIPMFDIVGRFMPETFNAEARTIEMTFTTSMPVRMWKFKGFFDIEEFNEILSMDPSHVRLDRMKKGAPFLNNHRRFSFEDQLGVVERVWIEGEELRGVVRFSKKKSAEDIFQEVKDGIIRNGSVGYKVHKYKDESKEGDKIKTLRAVDWEPVEMSLVPIPADHNAGVRSEGNMPPETHDCEIIFEQRNERTEEMPQAKETPTTTPTTTEVDQIRQQERDKNSKIMRACRQAKMPDSFSEQLVNSGKSLEDCLLMIQEKWAETDAQRAINPVNPTRVDIGGGLDETQTRREGAAEALLARHFPQDHKLTEKGYRFQNRSAIEICRLILELNGTRTERMSNHDLVQRAFMSTSDFTSILETSGRARLQKAYESVPQIFKQFSTETTLRDFKPNKVVHLGEAPAFEKLGQGGEIKMGTVGDSKEEYRLYTYAKGLAVTRETIINDDLGAFLKLSAAFGRAVAHLENRVAFKEAFLDNPTMGDSVAVFHNTHKNLSTGAAVSKASISAMKAKMKKQTDDKGQLLELSAKFILGGADNESTIKEILAGQNVNGGFNVHSGEFTPLITAMIEDNAHYLVADPNQIEGLEHSYLEGARGIQSETLTHPDTLGIIIRNWIDFGAKVINFRAFQKNPGA